MFVAHCLISGVMEGNRKFREEKRFLLADFLPVVALRSERTGEMLLRTHVRTQHARTHAHMHARTHARTSLAGAQTYELH